MNIFNLLDDPKFLIAATTLAWTALLALAKKAVKAVENKIDENARKVTALQSKMGVIAGETKYRIERNFRDLVAESRQDIKELSLRLDKVVNANGAQIEQLTTKNAERMDDFRRHAVTRDEFRMLATNIYNMLDAINNQLIQTGAKNRS